LWSASDINADGKLDKKEIRKLLDSINHDVQNEYFETLFKRHDKDAS
jgi:Ca2+-binding EF-hand superfamily protein